MDMSLHGVILDKKHQKYLTMNRICFWWGLIVLLLHELQANYIVDEQQLHSFLSNQ